MNLKAEPRGKYAGTKLHLDGPDSQEILDWYKLYKSGNAKGSPIPEAFAKATAKAIRDLLVENPDMLKDRTPEEIKASLLKDKAKIEKQLQAGKDWKKVE